MNDLLSAGPATRPINFRDLAENVAGEAIEACVHLHEISKDGVVQEVQQKPSHMLTQGYTERPVVALKISDRIFVIAYEVLSAEERREEALLLSARSKLTPEEFNAVQHSRKL